VKTALLPLLRCPQSGQTLSVRSDKALRIENGEIEEGCLESADRQYSYRIVGGIPRFVADSNYADNFGMQWNHFARTQLDSHSKRSISGDRFWRATGWTPDDLRNQWVLDAGCGSGRFAEIALGAGAKVVALDYSSAVDACSANLKQYADLHVVQGNIYALPFKPASFRFVYSLGVLQHTPDVAAAFAALPVMLEAPGKLCVDYYEKTFKSALLPKYWLRPITKRVPKAALFSTLERVVPAMLTISRALGRVPSAGRLLKRLIPVVNYDGIYELDETQLREWALLDTFDMLAPAYDHPQKATDVRRWLEAAGLDEIEVLTVDHLVGRGIRPGSAT
jgi:2-polyprenyl-3-methyl-5-hydroxy-6-metoxy-1,4-benzoquinol methylase